MEKETNREKQYKYYIEEFYKIACRVLADYPAQLKEFKDQWKERRYRQAYMPYMTIIHKEHIELPEREREVNREFYGLFVN